MLISTEQSFDRDADRAMICPSKITLVLTGCERKTNHSQPTALSTPVQHIVMSPEAAFTYPLEWPVVDYTIRKQPLELH